MFIVKFMTNGLIITIVDLLCQVSVSVQQIHLCDVTWLTTDAYKLMSCLSLTDLDGLVLDDECKLISSLSPASSSPLVKMNTIQIHAPLSINTLTSLISHMEVNQITFISDCQLLDMDMTPPQQVNQDRLYIVAWLFYMSRLANPDGSFGPFVARNSEVLGSNPSRVGCL